MRILVVHNHYRSPPPSGEDAVFRNEVQMLRKHGHDVFTYERFNNDLKEDGLLNNVTLATNTVWSRTAYQDLRQLIRTRHPDVVHIHNTFPQLSPSIFWACHAEGVPVVQTLHNYRFFCASGMFLRNGQPCELCVTGGLHNALRYKCYRGSYSATGTLVASISFNRLIGSFRNRVSRYIALTHFAAEAVIRAGLPSEKVVVKPNFIPRPPTFGSGGGGYAAYVGRIAQEKGVRTLVQAWSNIHDIPLKIAGEGPLKNELELLCKRNSLNVQFLGVLNHEEIARLLQDASTMIVPSEWYEGFPVVVVEAFACGTPIVAARIGSLVELAIEGVTGTTFTAGDPDDLKAAVRRILSDQPLLHVMRQRARQFFVEKLSEETNCAALIDIYRSVAIGER